MNLSSGYITTLVFVPSKLVKIFKQGTEGENVTTHLPGTNDLQPSLEDLWSRYVRSVVEHGVGLIPGQDLYIRVMAHARESALRAGETAYDLGAAQVHYRIIDMEEQAQLIRRARGTTVVEATQVHIRSWYLEILRSRSPLLVLSEIGPSNHYERLARDYPDNHRLFLQGLSDIGLSYMRQAVDLGQSACTITPAPSASWATRIFPDLPASMAEQKLLELLVPLVDLTPEELLSRREKDRERSHRLEALQIRELQVTGGGNDFRVRLPETARWIHTSGLQTKSGQRYYLNFPSEEVYTTPDFRYTTGRLVASRPFRLGNGVRVEGAVLEFEDGQVVKSSATVGAADLEQALATDEGARRLGEFALVSSDSPLARSQHFFDHILLDENAGSHVALGNGWKMAFGVDPLDDEIALESQGLNRSAIHTDIVFGSPEVTISASDSIQGEVVLLDGGSWRLS